MTQLATRGGTSNNDMHCISDYSVICVMEQSEVSVDEVRDVAMVVISTTGLQTGRLACCSIADLMALVEAT